MTNNALAKLAEYTLDESFDEIRNELLLEYLQEHNFPWIIGYSGGKDSTLVVHLVFEMLLNLPASKRNRIVHVLANDTLVESPLVAQHIVQSLEEMENGALTFNLPLVTKITHPPLDQSFWVNIIGRGYPSPNSNFRWCTNRMKILPTNNYIKSEVSEAGKVILLLGVRRSESINRSKTVQRYDNGTRLNPHNDLAGCMVYRPIVELSTEDVWEFISFNDPPWGGSHLKLIGLYRNASGGDCPVVTQQTDIPSCGSSSSRFGCWTCTVVDKDRSLEGFVESGFEEFGPLLDFRDWLLSIRNNKSMRQARRRDGRITITDTGTFVPGPFTLKARTDILTRLKRVEKQTGQNLISDQEINLIHEIWAEELKFQSGTKDMTIREVRKDK